MAFEGGYTSAVNDQTRRALADTEIQRFMFALMQAQQQQKVQEQAKSVPARANAFLPLGPPPVQPPAPGQPSMPMQPPPAAGPSPFGPQGGQPSPMMAPQPPVPMLSGGPQGAPPGAPPPVAGGMGAPGAGAPPVAPPAAPDSWKNMADAGAPSPGQAPQKITAQMWDLGESLKKMQDANVSPADQAAYIPYLADMIKQHNDTVAAQAKIDLEAQQTIAAAAEAAHRTAEAKKLNLEMASGGAGKKLPTEMANTIFAAGGDPNKGLDQQPPGVIERARKIAAAQETKKGSTTINIGGGGMLTDEGKRLAAEQYRKTGQLPPMYRDAKGRAEIINLAAQIEKEEGGDVADVPGRRAAFKADAASLTQRQRFVDAGNQFIKNMQSQADLVDKYMTKGAAGGVPVFNKWIQAGRKQLAGDADVTALDTAIRGLAREHQRIVTGVTSNAQLHVSAQETADQLLNVAQTPAQMRAAIKVMREEAQNAVEAGKQEVAEIRARMKGSGEAASPTPSGLREFKNLEDAKKAGMKSGMRVKIGGVEGSLKDE